MYAATDGSYTLLLLEDDDPMDPRKDYEPFGKMVCWHRRYHLGDQHDYSEPLDFLQDMAMTLFKDKSHLVFNFVKAGNSDSVRLQYDRSRRSWLLMESCIFGDESKWYETACYDHLMQNHQISSDALYDVIHAMNFTDLKALLGNVRGFILLPLYLYDHSGITMSTSPFNCPWDSGQVGYIYCTPDMLQSEYGSVSKKAIDNASHLLRSEVETYDQYLRGECYGFRLYKGDEEIDSCWGFLGDPDDLRTDLRCNLPPERAALVDRLEYTCESETTYLRTHSVA